MDTFYSIFLVLITEKRKIERSEVSIVLWEQNRAIRTNTLTQQFEGASHVLFLSIDCIAFVRRWLTRWLYDFRFQRIFSSKWKLYKCCYSSLCFRNKNDIRTMSVVEFCYSTHNNTSKWANSRKWKVQSGLFLPTINTRYAIVKCQKVIFAELVILPLWYQQLI